MLGMISEEQCVVAYSVILEICPRMCMCGMYTDWVLRASISGVIMLVQRMKLDQCCMSGLQVVPLINAHKCPVDCQWGIISGQSRHTVQHKCNDHPQ